LTVLFSDLAFQAIVVKYWTGRMEGRNERRRNVSPGFFFKNTDFIRTVPSTAPPHFFVYSRCGPAVSPEQVSPPPVPPAGPFYCYTEFSATHQRTAPEE
jgi:hypothetical protein